MGKPKTESQPFIVSDRVVGPIDIIPFYKNGVDKMLEIERNIIPGKTVKYLLNISLTKLK